MYTEYCVLFIRNALVTFDTFVFTVLDGYLNVML